MIKWLKGKISIIKNKHLLSKVSMIKDYIFAAIKIIIGIVIQSYFLSVSGLYSICVGLSKYAFFEGKNVCAESKDEAERIKLQYNYLAKMAFFLLTGSVIYVIYMARLFFYPSNFNYGEIPAITIAAFAFTEIILAVIHLKKAKGILHSGLRCVNLTSAITALVLAQVAILSFAHNNDASFYNALTGTIFGSICIVISVIMFAVYFRKRKLDYFTKEQTKEVEEICLEKTSK